MMTETVVTVDQSQAAPPNAAQHGQAKPDNSLNWIKFNFQYFQSIPGILKLVQLVSFLMFHVRYRYLIRNLSADEQKKIEHHLCKQRYKFRRPVDKISRRVSRYD